MLFAKFGNFFWCNCLCTTIITKRWLKVFSSFYFQFEVKKNLPVQSQLSWQISYLNFNFDLCYLCPLTKISVYCLIWKIYFISVWGQKPKAFEWLLMYVILAQSSPISIGLIYLWSILIIPWLVLVLKFYQKLLQPTMSWIMSAYTNIEKII